MSNKEDDQVTVLAIQKHLDTNFTLYDTEEYQAIRLFFDEEEQYVHHLETLESQMFELQFINVPYYDLENLFGCITEIKNFHKYDLPGHAIKCVTIEEIFMYFNVKTNKLRWYILDQFKKFQTKFQGKKALHKRFYASNIDYSLTLPERRIVSFIKFHSYLKGISHLTNSLVLYNSLKCFESIFAQMQLSKQLAAIYNVPQSICFYNDILCIDNFQVSIDGSTQMNYRVYCLDNFILLTSLLQGSSLHMHKIDYTIECNKMSFTRNSEGLHFELIAYLENHKKRQFILTTDDSNIKSKWMDAIQNILYRQLIEEKNKAKTP